ncbi:MAG: SufD family Fe-S cluster assembly protein [Bacteroidota bacterium]
MANKRLEKLTQWIVSWLILQKEKEGVTIPYLADWQKELTQQWHQKGLPIRGHKEYRHTPFLPLLSQIAQEPSFNFPAQIAHKTLGNTPEAPFYCQWINGQIAQPKSHQLMKGVRLYHLSQLNTTQQEKVNAILQANKTYIRDTFQLLNSAFLQEGIWIDIADNTTCADPIWISQVISSQYPSMVHPWLLITVGRGSQVTMINTPPQAIQYPIWCNEQVQVSLDERAQLDYYYLPSRTPSTTHTTLVTQQAASEFYHYAHITDNTMLRHVLDVHLLASKSKAYLYGLYTGQAQQYQEMHAAAHHHAPATESHVQYRGIVGDHAQAVFYGNAIVYPDCSKSIAHQSHRGWPVSSHAHLHTYPQLNIKNDDVQCSHHATLQTLDPTALTYLQAKGITHQEATLMLVKAFLEEIPSYCKQKDVKKRSFKEIVDFLHIFLQKNTIFVPKM